MPDDLYHKLYAAANKSVFGRMLSRRNRSMVAASVHNNARCYRHSSSLTRDQIKQRILADVKYDLKRENVGFPWITIAMFVAQILLKIVIEKWFSERS